MIPEYLEKQIQEKSQEIVTGFETTNKILEDMGLEPTGIKRYIQVLKAEYIGVIGYNNGLRNSDIEDKHRIKEMSLRRAIKVLEEIEATKC